MRKCKMAKKRDKDKLSQEEREIVNSFERGEWQSVKNVNTEKGVAKKAARETLEKGVRINIRLSKIDLDHIKLRAAHEGLPYQTLISSILHKYAAGHLA